MPVRRHQRIRVLIERQAKQGSLLIGPAPQQGGSGGHRAAIALPQVQHRACGRLLAHLQVRQHLVASARQHALDQQLQLAARGFLAIQTRLHHLRVVENQQVQRAEEIR